MLTMKATAAALSNLAAVNDNPVGANLVDVAVTPVINVQPENVDVNDGVDIINNGQIDNVVVNDVVDISNNGRTVNVVVNDAVDQIDNGAKENIRPRTPSNDEDFPDDIPDWELDMLSQAMEDNANSSSVNVSLCNGKITFNVSL